MPPRLPLTSERLERHGLFLIEDGQNIFIWVGREAVPQLIMDVFDLPSYEALRGGKVSDIDYTSERECRADCVHQIANSTYA
jgi:protein transport protein SEC24